jgi:hypothetical protein
LWVAASGCQSHIAGNPAPLLDNSYQLTSSSPKDNAIGLPSYFSTDKLGVTRPQGSGWDIGAYEYGQLIQSIVPGLTFEAESGVITAPFSTTNGYIYQPIQTTLTASGRASYIFTVSETNDYGVVTIVNAPSDAANSFYINIDAEPQDPYMVWDIPVTAGFQQRLVSWRGNGTDVTNDFAPKYFNLIPGPHQLIIHGREANVQLDKITIQARPAMPNGLVRTASTGP